MSKASDPAKEARKEPGKQTGQERAQAFALGKLTLQELYNIAGPKMLDAAVKGFTLYEEQQYSEAEKTFRGLAALNPKEPYYMTALGAVYLAQDKIDDALRCFDYSISLSQKDIAAFVNRGEVYLRKNMMKEAAQDFKAAVEIDPTGNDGLVHRARVLWAAALEGMENKGKAEDKKPKPPKGKKKS